MQLLKTKTEILEHKSVPGVLTCTIKHEIKSTTAIASYDGPKMPPEMWQGVLAFLKWVYDTTHSEAQVRLYMNTKENTWKAWAYPQEASTGMSAREMDTKDAKKQREQFKDSDGWTYFGTVHSHCSCSAFQSGTDEANEANQDGLHVTIGHLDKAHYDLDARFYRSQMKFKPDLSEFWDIGEPWASASPDFVFHAEVAKWQMCEPDKEAKFPEEWKTNLVEPPKPPERTWLGNVQPHEYVGYSPTNKDAKGAGELSKREMKEILREPEWKRRDLCAEEIEARFELAMQTGQQIENDLAECINFMTDPTVAMICRTCKKYNVDPEDMNIEFRLYPAQEETRQYGLPATGLGGMMD
jgi:hypothetical protein